MTRLDTVLLAAGDLAETFLKAFLKAMGYGLGGGIGVAVGLKLIGFIRMKEGLP